MVTMMITNLINGDYDDHHPKPPPSSPTTLPLSPALDQNFETNFNQISGKTSHKLVIHQSPTYITETTKG